MHGKQEHEVDESGLRSGGLRLGGLNAIHSGVCVGGGGGCIDGCVT